MVEEVQEEEEEKEEKINHLMNMDDIKQFDKN